MGNVGLTQIVTIIDAAQHSLRTLTFKISPPVLHDLGFKAALDWLVEHCKELYGLNVSFEGDVRLDPIDERMSVVLFRSIRELLINVAKHAQTAEAKLTCHCRNGALEVIVSDEGTGFDDDAETSGDGTKGFGLFSIRERLGYLGGTMQIRTAPGSGTSVVLQVSMSGEAERQEANPA